MPAIESESLGGGKEVLTPDGRKAKLYNVDEFMRLHGVDLEAELKKRETAAQADTQVNPDAPDEPASDTQNHIEATKTDPSPASDSAHESDTPAPPADSAN